MVAQTKIAVKGTCMQLDIGQLTNGEIEDMEEYAKRPVMGLINRALQEAGSERTVKGKDAMGRELEETVFEIDADVMLDMLPAKVVTALNCITKRRKDPSFTIDKWRDGLFGDDGSEAPAPNPPQVRSQNKRKPSARRSSGNSPNSTKSDSSSTPPSATPSPVTPLSSARSSRRKNSAPSRSTTTNSSSEGEDA